jgi:hypothetical protein
MTQGFEARLHIYSILEDGLASWDVEAKDHAFIELHKFYAYEPGQGRRSNGICKRS